ncbi:hypothetical protein ACE6H2_021360 [Prunus campanulata]
MSFFSRTAGQALISQELLKALIRFVDVAGLCFALTQLTHGNISQKVKIINSKQWDWLLKPEDHEDGQVPRTVECELLEDLVDACILGDVVTVTGIMRVINNYMDVRGGKEIRPNSIQYSMPSELLKALIGFIDVAGLFLALTRLTHGNISQKVKIINSKQWDLELLKPEDHGDVWVPRTVECELLEDLVDACIPGDVVTVTGIMRVVHNYMYVSGGKEIFPDSIQYTMPSVTIYILFLRMQLPRKEDCTNSPH